MYADLRTNSVYRLFVVCEKEEDKAKQSISSVPKRVPTRERIARIKVCCKVETYTVNGSIQGEQGEVRTSVVSVLSWDLAVYKRRKRI